MRCNINKDGKCIECGRDFSKLLSRGISPQKIIAECKADKPLYNTGTILHNLFIKDLGIKQETNCSCKNVELWMNRIGPDLSLEYLEDICSAIKDNAKILKKPFSKKACETIVKLAIRIEKAGDNPTAFEKAKIATERGILKTLKPVMRIL